VRDGGGEACPELLVGGEVACGAQVQQRLAPAVDLVWDLERRSASQVEEGIRERGALGQALERLSRAATRRQHAPLLIEHDHDLAALLDQKPAASGLEGEVAFFEIAGTAPAQKAADHHLFTESSLAWHPRVVPSQRS